MKVKSAVIAYHVDETVIKDKPQFETVAEAIMSFLEVLYGDGFVTLTVSEETFEAEDEEDGKE